MQGTPQTYQNVKCLIPVHTMKSRFLRWAIYCGFHAIVLSRTCALLALSTHTKKDIASPTKPIQL